MSFLKIPEYPTTLLWKPQIWHVILITVHNKHFYYLCFTTATKKIQLNLGECECYFLIFNFHQLATSLQSTDNMVLSSSSPRSISLSKKEKECFKQETCFVFNLYVLGKSMKNVRDLIKNCQIESISPVPYITL